MRKIQNREVYKKKEKSNGIERKRKIKLSSYAKKIKNFIMIGNLKFKESQIRSSNIVRLL